MAETLELSLLGNIEDIIEASKLIHTVHDILLQIYLQNNGPIK